MNKQTPNIDGFNNLHQYIGSLLAGIIFFGLLVAWGVEQLVKTVFSLS